MAIEKIRIDNADIFLEDLGENAGKLTISDTYDNNYSYYWGSMGSTLKQFICRINKEYFGGKLIGIKDDMVFDSSKTFAELRKYIAKELNLPWYNHLEFQRNMREVLNDFQKSCEELGEHHFVYCFKHEFVERLDYYQIKDQWDRNAVEKDFKEISEVWNFIHKKESRKLLWLYKLHGKLVKEFKKEPIQQPL